MTTPREMILRENPEISGRRNGKFSLVDASLLVGVAFGMTLLLAFLSTGETGFKGGSIFVVLPVAILFSFLAVRPFSALLGRHERAPSHWELLTLGAIAMPLSWWIGPGWIFFSPFVVMAVVTLVKIMSPKFYKPSIAAFFGLWFVLNLWTGGPDFQETGLLVGIPILLAISAYLLLAASAFVAAIFWSIPAIVFMFLPPKGDSLVNHIELSDYYFSSYAGLSAGIVVWAIVDKVSGLLGTPGNESLYTALQGSEGFIILGALIVANMIQVTRDEARFQAG